MAGLRSFYSKEDFVLTWASFEAIIDIKNKEAKGNKRLTRSQVICELINGYVEQNKGLLDKPIDSVATPDGFT